jgi:hypothetical protein
MPLVDYNVELVAEALKAMRHGEKFTRRVACFSTPDLICRREVLERHFGLGSTHGVPERPDSHLIVGWHKAWQVMQGEAVLDTRAFFEKQGYELTCFDVAEGRGGEVLHDLCEPLPAEYRGRFDLLFDCITNQVFHVGMALRNALDCVRVGGHVVHCVPATLLNQGFYNFSPTLFGDFYRANGASVSRHDLVEGVYGLRRRWAVLEDHDCERTPWVGYEEEPVSRTKRIRALPDDVMHLVCAVKNQDQPSVWPVMTKFKAYPDAKRDLRGPRADA